MAPPSWAPSLAQVAIHIPTRTREVGGDDYSGGYAGTFTTLTTPTAVEATEHIAQACIKVLGEVGTPVAAAAEDSCRVAAAWWAAYSIEVGYPERDADVKVYEELRTQAEAAAKAANILNAVAGGGGQYAPETSEALLPSHSFQAAPAWADVVFW